MAKRDSRLDPEKFPFLRLGEKQDLASSGLPIRRRTFLQFTGLSASAALLPFWEGCVEDAFELEGPGFSADYTLHLLRRDDLVVLRFDFSGLKLSEAGDALVRVGDKAPRMVVTHPAQHLLERALDEGSPPATLPRPVAARLSGLSRIAMLLPDDVDDVPLTSAALLDLCMQGKLLVVPNALPPPPQLSVPGNIVAVATNVGVLKPQGGAIVMSRVGSVAVDTTIGASRSIVTNQRVQRGASRIELSSGTAVTNLTAVDARVPDILAKLSPREPVLPGPWHTRLELPYRLLLSPNELAAWKHALKPVASPAGRTELWHTRLAVRASDGTIDESAKSAKLRTVRAVWTRDPGFDPNDGCSVTGLGQDPPFLASLSRKDRIKLVHQSANYVPQACADDQPKPGAPRPVDVNRLMLSSLGGWMDVRGNWTEKAWLGLESWEHRATQGRDQYVKVVYAGYLYPFGHRASLIKITERKFTTLAPYTAYLWQRQFLLIREPIRTYPSNLRQFPFSVVHIKTHVTPPLSGGPDPDHAFVPHVNSKLFRFDAEALDREGRVVHLNLGAAWVPAQGGVTTNLGLNGGSGWDGARDLYVGDVAVQKLAGQRLAFAASDQAGDTTYEVDEIELAEPVYSDPTPPSYLKYWPALTRASLRVDALRQLLGTASSHDFSYADAYLQHDFAGGNPGQLLFETAAPLGVNFLSNSSRSGGFVAPSIDIKGISRLVGPVGGDLAKAQANQFDPTSFFDSIDAKLFGVFDLKDVLKTVLPGDGGLLSAPKFITQTLNDIETLLDTAATLKVELQRYDERLAELGAGADSIMDDLRDATAQLLDDINALGGDADALSAAITTIVDTDLPALVSALSAAASHVASSLPAGVGIGLTNGLATKIADLSAMLSAAASTLADALKAFHAAQDLVENMCVKLEWRPPIQGFPASDPIFDPKREDGLLLSVEVRAKDQPGKPAGVDLLCALEDFDINLIAPATFFSLTFERVAFKVESGKKPDVDVVFNDLLFDGILYFVDKLRQVIPLEGFSDPPSLDVSESGIEAGFSLGLPNLAVGVFSLTNMSLGAGFRIPFVGDPLSVRFNFCTRENPFNLTVSFLGGGGFFGMQVSPKSTLMLEASIEFGASLSIDFGVASGSISVMAGIYFRMEQDDCSLTGYLRMRGRVDVLGLITASLEMLMELTYEFSSHKVIGRASIEIEVSVAFFSATVTVKAERKFSGSNGDPTFEELMAPEGNEDPWAEYLGAFELAA